MRLEWWGTDFMGVWKQIDESVVFRRTPNKHMLLVETQEEWNMVDVLQFLHGVEVVCEIVERPDMATIEAYAATNLWVYTSWDPLDQNRY